MEHVGLFDESMDPSSDWELWIRISRNWPVVSIPEPLAFYRVHRGNTTFEVLQTGKAFESWLRLLNHHFKSDMEYKFFPVELRQKAISKVYFDWAWYMISIGDNKRAIEKLCAIARISPRTAIDNARAIASYIQDTEGVYQATEFPGEMSVALEGV